MENVNLRISLLEDLMSLEKESTLNQETLEILARKYDISSEKIKEILSRLKVVQVTPKGILIDHEAVKRKLTTLKEKKEKIEEVLKPMDLLWFMLPSESIWCPKRLRPIPKSWCPDLLCKHHVANGGPCFANNTLC